MEYWDNGNSEIFEYKYISYFGIGILRKWKRAILEFGMLGYKDIVSLESWYIWDSYTLNIWDIWILKLCDALLILVVVVEDF